MASTKKKRWQIYCFFVGVDKPEKTIQLVHFWFITITGKNIFFLQMESKVMNDLKSIEINANLV